MDTDSNTHTLRAQKRAHFTQTYIHAAYTDTHGQKYTHTANESVKEKDENNGYKHFRFLDILTEKNSPT